MSNNVIDIIECFQTRHALQEEREMNDFHASTNCAVAPGMPEENGRSKTAIFAMEEVRVWTVAVLGNTNWSPPHDGRDRMVLTLGRIRQLPRESDSAFPARWTCIPANSDCNVANETEQTMNLMIVEFIANDRPSIIPGFRVINLDRCSFTYSAAMGTDSDVAFPSLCACDEWAFAIML